jgi:hypothetical protein
MKANKFLFVNSTGSPGSARERELARSQARSHAALASHSQSRHQQHDSPNGAHDSNGKENLPPDEGSPSSSKASSPGELSQQPVNIRFRLHVPGQKKASSSVKVVSQKPVRSKKNQSPRTEPQLPPIRLLKPINKSSLDPFVRPAADLSVPDQHLLHLCKGPRNKPRARRGFHR